MLDCCTFHPINDPNCWQRQLYQTMLDRWTTDLRCVFIYDYDPGKAIDVLQQAIIKEQPGKMFWAKD